MRILIINGVNYGKPTVVGQLIFVTKDFYLLDLLSVSLKKIKNMKNYRKKNRL